MNEDKIVTELSSGYPALLAGFDKEYSGSLIGHTWLAYGLMRGQRHVVVYDFRTMQIVEELDEYRWYIKYNYGWSGTADGYYLYGFFDTREEVSENREPVLHTSTSNMPCQW